MGNSTSAADEEASVTTSLTVQRVAMLMGVKTIAITKSNIR